MEYFRKLSLFISALPIKARSYAESAIPSPMISLYRELMPNSESLLFILSDAALSLPQTVAARA